MNALIIVLELALALLFLVAGVAKLFKSYESLNERMKWTREKSVTFIRIIAISEILGALGLIIPRYLNIMPFLSTIAAFGLAIIMFGAPITHLKLGENKEAFFTTVIFFLLALTVGFRYYL